MFSQASTNGLSISKNQGEYSICNLGITNLALKNQTELRKEDKIGVVDAMFLTNVVYNATTEEVQGELFKYYGDDWCTEYNETLQDQSCSSEKYRFIESHMHENPKFIHIYQPNTKFHIVAIRGTLEAQDAIMDLVLWSEISSIQMVGSVFPIFSVWTAKIIISVVDACSMFSKSINPHGMSNYYQAPLTYLKNNNIPQEDEYLLVVGHSLGGGVAQIVGANVYEDISQNVMSFGLSSPGTFYSSKKFGFETESLQFTSVTVLGERDPVPMTDKHVGLYEKIKCNREVSIDCHGTFQSICEMTNSCWKSYNATASKTAWVTNVCGDTPDWSPQHN